MSVKEDLNFPHSMPNQRKQIKHSHTHTHTRNETQWNLLNQGNNYI